MASSSLTSSSFPAAETPIAQRGSGINVANFVSSKLRRDRNWNNYKSWKEQMLCLVESQGLLEFIDNEAPPPLPKGSVDYVAWRRSDRLVKGWILGALSDETLQNVVHLDSARDVWLDLEKAFSTAQSQQGNFYYPPPPPSNDTPSPPITYPGATPPPPPPPSSYPVAPPPITSKPVVPLLKYQQPLPAPPPPFPITYLAAPPQQGQQGAPPVNYPPLLQPPPPPPPLLTRQQVKSLLADVPFSSPPKKKSKKRARQEASVHIDEQTMSAGLSERTVDLETMTGSAKARRLLTSTPRRHLIDEDVEALEDRLVVPVLEKEKDISPTLKFPEDTTRALGAFKQAADALAELLSMGARQAENAALAQQQLEAEKARAEEESAAAEERAKAAEAKALTHKAEEEKAQQRAKQLEAEVVELKARLDSAEQRETDWLSGQGARYEAFTEKLFFSERFSGIVGELAHVLNKKVEADVLDRVAAVHKELRKEDFGYQRPDSRSIYKAYIRQLLVSMTKLPFKEHVVSSKELLSAADIRACEVDMDDDFETLRKEVEAELSVEEQSEDEADEEDEGKTSSQPHDDQEEKSHHTVTTSSLCGRLAFLCPLKST